MENINKEYKLFLDIVKNQIGTCKKVDIPKKFNQDKFLFHVKETTTEAIIYNWLKKNKLPLSEINLKKIKEGKKIIKEKQKELSKSKKILLKSPLKIIFLKDSVFPTKNRFSLDVDVLATFGEIFKINDYLKKKGYTSYLGKIMYKKGFLDKLVENSNNLIKRKKIEQEIQEEYFSIIEENKEESKENLIDEAANYKSITYYSDKSVIDVHYRLFTKDKPINLKINEKDLIKIKENKYNLKPETNLVYMAGHYVSHFHLQFGTLKRQIDLKDVLGKNFDWDYALKKAEESFLTEKLWIFLKHGKDILNIKIPKKVLKELEEKSSKAQKFILKKVDPFKLILNKKTKWEKIYLKTYLNKNNLSYKTIDKFHASYNAYFKGEKKDSEYPPHILIEPTNMCNLQCPLCVTGSGASDRKKSFMSFKMFKKIVDEIKGKTQMITISGYGEPFLNKDILKMISYAHKAKIKIYMNTNAHFITSLEKAKKIVKSGIDNIKVSLDGVDQKTYEKYRKNGKFEKVIQGIKYLVQAKKELEIETPKIVLLYLVMKHNESHRIKAKKLAKKLQVDLFHEKPICLSDYQEEEFLELAQKYLPKDKTMIRYKDLKARGNFGGEIANDCNRVYHTLIINAQGKVVPCVNDHHNKYILGDVSQKSIIEIWKGEKFNKFREHIKKDQKNIDICRNCPASRKKETKHKFTKIK